jgi:hypothetical protein
MHSDDVVRADCEHPPSRQQESDRRERPSAREKKKSPAKPGLFNA